MRSAQEVALDATKPADAVTWHGKVGSPRYVHMDGLLAHAALSLWDTVQGLVAAALRISLAWRRDEWKLKAHPQQRGLCLGV